MGYLSKIRRVLDPAIRSESWRFDRQTSVPPTGVSGGSEVAGYDPSERELANLRALGLLDRFEKYPEPIARPDPSDLPLIRLMERLPLVIMPLASDGCPVCFCSVFAELDRIEQTPMGTGRMLAVGQGLTRRDAVLAGLGEIAERLSILSRNDDDPLIVEDRHSDVPAGPALHFSVAQEDGLCRDHALIDAARTQGAIDWESVCRRRVRVSPLSGVGQGLATSLLCLLREERRYGVRDVPIASSNGAASWRDVEGALQRAVLELVERDSVACWWYNRLMPLRYADEAV